MKRYFSLFVMVVLLTVLFVGCSDTKDNESTTTTTENSTTLITTDTITEAQSENQTNKKETTTTTTTTKKSQGNSLISDENMERIENSNAETYFTDNPDNQYIIRISEKYGVKKENLVVLIKINAEFPSATIFEFSGKKDSNGELVMTYDELVNVYEINEEKNTIIRVSKNGLNNDGVNLIEAKIYMTLVKEYLLPELPGLRENKRYPE